MTVKENLEAWLKQKTDKDIISLSEQHLGFTPSNEKPLTIRNVYSLYAKDTQNLKIRKLNDPRR